MSVSLLFYLAIWRYVMPFQCSNKSPCMEYITIQLRWTYWNFVVILIDYTIFENIDWTWDKLQCCNNMQLLLILILRLHFVSILFVFSLINLSISHTDYSFPSSSTTSENWQNLPCTNILGHPVTVGLGASSPTEAIQGSQVRGPGSAGRQRSQG